MDYYELIARAVDYIERNLTEEITLEDIAASANLSIAHLYRVFPIFFGRTVGQYIRQRRLSEAAVLLNSQKSSMDIALEYRFETQEGFIRSFKAMFGITPGEYRKYPAALPLYHRANIKKQTGDIVMNPNMTVKQFTLIGMEAKIDLNTDFSVQIQELTNAIKSRFHEITSAGDSARIINYWYMKFEQSACLNEPSTCFFTGIEAPSDAVVPNGMTLQKLPSSLYAVFKEKQRGTVGGPEGYAYRLWLPDSGYALNDDIPGDFEVYPDSVHIGYDDACEIYIPVCNR